jgi:dTDP-4-amino-4,6-dideoxy-D-galactose acyltransferase
METDSFCQFLEWDSNFFGVRIGRVIAPTLTESALERIGEWCRQERIDCLYLLVDSNDSGAIRLAEDNGFHFMDLRATLRKWSDYEPAADPSASEWAIRPFQHDDLAALGAIARVSHHDSRFYHDPNFPRAKCDALYETWIAKSCNGSADAVLVAEHEGRPVGYATCQIVDQGKGQIGLLGIDPGAQGMGLGQSLIRATLHWFAGQGINDVSVVTQGRNCGAQRVYQRCGLIIYTLQLWFHKWFLARTSRQASILISAAQGNRDGSGSALIGES